MRNTWEIHVFIKYMGNTWGIHEQKQENTWGIHGKYMVILLVVATLIAMSRKANEAACHSLEASAFRCVSYQADQFHDNDN